MYSKKPRDMFVEAGYGPNFADQLIQNAFSKLFEGDPIDERVCFDASDDMAYIIDIGHDDIRSEGMSYGMFIAALTGHDKLLYIAAALLIAAKKFGRDDYKQEAIELINCIKNKPFNELVGPMIDPERKLIKFSPVLGNDFTDPSYHTIAFYRAYADATGDKDKDREREDV